jgi:transposase-like protein
MLPSNRRLATIWRYGRCNSGSDLSRAMKADQDFLLYPLATEGRLDCPACGRPMEIVVYEARENSPDFSRFRCTGCKRSETFVCEE